MNRHIKYKLIGCNVLQLETEALIKQLGADVDCNWIELGLHDEPPKMRAAIQEALDEVAGDYDAVLLIYGLCSNGTAGLRCPPELPVVMPRCHDCISLFLGSAAKYSQQHAAEPGTYWFSRAFLHRRESALYGSGEFYGFAPGEQEFTPVRRAALYREYVEKYGEENADFLMETYVDAWKRNYTRAVFVRSDYPGVDTDGENLKRVSEQNGWRFEEMNMETRLLTMMLTGEWPDSEFLVIPPGQTIVAAHDGGIVGVACGLKGCVRGV